jgi:hypothetical protein
MRLLPRRPRLESEHAQHAVVAARGDGDRDVHRKTSEPSKVVIMSCTRRTLTTSRLVRMSSLEAPLRGGRVCQRSSAATSRNTSLQVG